MIDLWRSSNISVCKWSLRELLLIWNISIEMSMQLIDAEIFLLDFAMLAKDLYSVDFRRFWACL
jgi:hypothetical protein